MTASCPGRTFCGLEQGCAEASLRPVTPRDDCSGPSESPARLAARRWSGVPFGRRVEIEGEEHPEGKRRHAKEQQQGQLVEAKGADDDIYGREQGVDGPNTHADGVE